MKGLIVTISILILTGLASRSEAQGYVYNFSEGVTNSTWSTIYAVTNPTGQPTNIAVQFFNTAGYVGISYYAIPALSPGQVFRIDVGRHMGEHGSRIISNVPLQVRRLVFNGSSLVSDVRSAGNGGTHNWRGACTFPGAVYGYITLLNTGAGESSVWIKTTYGQWENIVVPPYTRRTHFTTDLSGYYAFSSNGAVTIEEAVYNSSYTAGKVCQY